jgi:hypothetical protein
MLQNGSNGQGWLILIYRVPSTPSTSRVTIWRRVKELGAFFLQQSVYILPKTHVTREAVDALKEQIQHLGGESKILEVSSLGREQEKEVIAGFNNNREEEYVEVIKACKELLLEIDEESKTEDFHFADLEENEKHLQRVKELLDNVTKRDYFGSSSKSRAVQMVNECGEKFETFSHEVFSREGIVTDDKKPAVGSDTGSSLKQRKVYSRGELITMLKEIVDSLSNSTLDVGNKKVSPLSAESVLEWDYRVNKEDNSLEIRINWKSNPVEHKNRS